MADRWISAEQVRLSLIKLREVHPYFGMAFLAFKEDRLPVGRQKRMKFSSLMRSFLDRYYRVSDRSSSPCYYNPFATSNRSSRWLSNRSADAALRRMTVDTFGAAVVHEKNQPMWGWRDDYVDVLAGFQSAGASSLIPIFHLAVWLFRGERVQDGFRPADLMERFENVFNVLADEKRLFDFSCEAVDLAEDRAGEREVSGTRLLRIIGQPLETIAAGAVALDFMEFAHVGPARRLRYEPGSRVNIVTGDNSLGKTFLLESIWWAVTGRWIESAPRPKEFEAAPRISFGLSAIGRKRNFDVRYDRSRQAWSSSERIERPGGIAIYSRYDGSHVVWDTTLGNGGDARLDEQVMLDGRELWHGKRGDGAHGHEISICNGLLLDWVAWQTKQARYGDIFEAFVRCLKILSPPEGRTFEPDEPMWIPGDEREIPTLKMDYGTIPVLHASAGVRRIIGLAYVATWAWFRHKRNASAVQGSPRDRMVLIVDEVEAHLHPRWQRSVVPAILEAMDALSGDLRVQAHFATHSPLVLASVEPVLRRDEDSLHHLALREGSVELDVVDFKNQGSVDAWLTSDVFGLRHARSMQAEMLIERAKEEQMKDEPDAARVAEIDKGLARHLRDDDEFWPRWRYFADAACRRRR